MAKKYPPEFKADVARVARGGDMTLKEVAIDFDVSVGRHWLLPAPSSDSDR